MTTQEIEKYLEALNDELDQTGVKGEICLYGGAMMCLVYQARPSTKDVDAVFQPATQMREAAERAAQAYGLRSDWPQRRGQRLCC
jgi:methylmalonyl-CoA mutase cobalamin-binding subunit